MNPVNNNNKNQDEMNASTDKQRSTAQSALLLIGSLGPLGYAPASGTVAVAVAGIPLYWLMVTYLTTTQYVVVTIVFALLAMLVHHAGDRILGESDSRKLVWDELVGFFIAMFLIHPTWQIITIGFFLERFIDIVKVPPANIIDNKMHNGVGVVLDDVIAGLYTLGILHLIVYFVPAWGT